MHANHTRRMPYSRTRANDKRGTMYGVTPSPYHDQREEKKKRRQHRNQAIYSTLFLNGCGEKGSDTSLERWAHSFSNTERKLRKLRVFGSQRKQSAPSAFEE